MRGDPKAASVYYDDDVTYIGSPGSVNNPMIIEDFWDLIESTPTGLKSINDLEYFNYRRYCKFVNDIDFNDYPEILDGFMDNNFPLLDGGTVKYGYFIRFTDIDGNGCSLRNLCMIKYNKSTQDVEIDEDSKVITEIDSGIFTTADTLLKMSFLNLFCKKGSIFGGGATFTTCIIKNLNVLNLIMFQCRDNSVLKCDACFGTASYDYTLSPSFAGGAGYLFETTALKFVGCNFGVYINGDSSFRSIFRGDYTTNTFPSNYYSKDHPQVTLVRCTVNLKGILNVYNTLNRVASYHTKQIFDISNIKTMYCHLNYNILNLMQTTGPNNYARSLLYVPNNTAYSVSKAKAFGFNYITGNFKILFVGGFGFYITHGSTANCGLYMDNCYINANFILYDKSNNDTPGYHVNSSYNIASNLSTCFINISKIQYYSSYLDMYVNTPASISTSAEQTASKMYLLEDSQCKDYNYLDSIGFLVVPAT